MMHFQVSLDEICQEIGEYNNIITELSDIAKDVYNTIDPLINSNWSGRAQRQYKKDMDVWQSQVGKFLEDADFVNKVLANTVNVKTVEMKKMCNGFIDCIK